MTAMPPECGLAFLVVITDGGGRRPSHRFGDAMSYDKIRDAARRRMARTGASYATARRRVIRGAPGLARRQPNLGSTAAASCSICSRWSNSAVNKMSSAPAAATWFTSRTQSAAVPVIAAASMAGTRCP